MFLKDSYRLPAEWEPQSGVQLTWPHAGTDWAPMLDEITATYREIAEAIEKYEPVLSVSVDNVQRSMFNVQCTTDDTWARDHGFITLVNDCGGVRLLDFQFNGWGDKFPAEQDNHICRNLMLQGIFKGEYEDHLDFVLEGGSIESDGQGTIFTTTGCLMAPHRNQPMTQEQIEQRLKQSLCAERVVWINHGNLIGDDTDGHIDTLVRICPDDTLLYIAADDDHPDLLRMEEELYGLRTLSGRPYRLLKLPMPHPIYDGEDRLPATYANFLVINGAVLCPTYGQPDLDAEALRLIGEAFPGRDIIGIDCRSIIRQHGSLHCCTMQYPQNVIV